MDIDVHVNSELSATAKWVDSPGGSGLAVVRFTEAGRRLYPGVTFIVKNPLELAEDLRTMADTLREGVDEEKVVTEDATD